MSPARGLTPLRRTFVVTARLSRVSAPSRPSHSSRSHRARVTTGTHAADDADADAVDVERVTSVDNAAVKHFARLCKSKAYREERLSLIHI